MPIRPCRMFAVLAVAALAAAPAVLAQARPGVGYDPQGRGLSITYYILDSLLNPYTSYRADFSAHPDLVGASPNPYYLDYSDAAVKAAVELRWGPGTASGRFKRWKGPGDEVRFVLRDAMVWAAARHPELLGGDTSNRNGKPTEVEITDAQAFNDNALWTAYFQSEVTGYSPDRRAVICDAGKPAGDGQSTDPFWGLTYYFHNNFEASPYSPQLPSSLACGGN